VFRRARRVTLAAAAVGVVAGLVPAASASALAPGDGGIAAAPTVTAPPAIPSVSASDLSLSLVADSVVATATIRYPGAPPDAIVAWGDGARSRTSPPTASVPGRPVPTSGKLVFQHVYAAPTNGARFFNEHISVVSPVSGGELVGGDVVIVPRYRVTQHTVDFSPLDHCDSVAEAYTEWTVFRRQPLNAASLPSRAWNFDRHTADRGGVGLPLPDFEPLPDSAASIETTVGQAPKVGYTAIEIDPLRSEFFAPMFVDFDPLLGSRTITLTAGEVYGADCRVQIRTSIDIQLLTPGLATGPVASQ
jgi:hypothetical protein